MTTPERADAEMLAYLAGLAHDLRATLNPIQGYTGLLLYTDLSDEQREYVDTMRRYEDRARIELTCLVEILHLLAGTLGGGQTWIEPAALLQEALEQAQTWGGPEIETHLEMGGGLPARVKCPAHVETIWPALMDWCMRLMDETGRTGTLTLGAAAVGTGRLRFSIRQTFSELPSTHRETLQAYLARPPASPARHIPLTLTAARLLAGFIHAELTVEVGSTFLRVDLEFESGGE